MSIDFGKVSQTYRITTMIRTNDYVEKLMTAIHALVFEYSVDLFTNLGEQ